MDEGVQGCHPCAPPPSIPHTEVTPPCPAPLWLDQASLPITANYMLNMLNTHTCIYTHTEAQQKTKTTTDHSTVDSTSFQLRFALKFNSFNLKNAKNFNQFYFFINSIIYKILLYLGIVSSC